jgi:asparagine synthase (glutamine-hydrolysing)
MSGIFGIVRWNERGVELSELESMQQAMVHRGRAETILDSHAGLGHLLIHPIQGQSSNSQLWKDPVSGQVICADARIDNRDELVAKLGIGSDFSGNSPDCRLILAAYQKWGNQCAHHLCGDFAFVIWDSRQRRLFCARDHMGMKPLYYFSCREFFVFASSAQAIFRIDGVHQDINQARVADFLIQDFEGIDTSCTFFEAVSRLSPAHTLEVNAQHCRELEYWNPDPDFELELKTDEDYLEAFREIFSRAIKDRLRSPTPVASMLSGGIDSSVIAAVAQNHVGTSTGSGFSTVSAVSEKEESCLESRFVRRMINTGDFDAQQIKPSDLGLLRPDFQRLLDMAEDPFDTGSTVPALMYLAAMEKGHHVLLDGVDGDLAVSLRPAYPAHFLREGHFRQAWAETRASCRNYHPDKIALTLFPRMCISALQPKKLRKFRLEVSRETRIRKKLKNSLVSPELIGPAGLVERYSDYDRRVNTGSAPGLRQSHINRIRAPYLVAAVERYGRLASYCGIENRAPLLDRRLLEFSISLPWNQKVRNGWSKYILRKFAETVVPREIAWRKDHTHVGWEFTRAWLNICGARITDVLTEGQDLLEPYIEPSRLAQLIRDYGADRPGAARDARVMVNLVNWLERNTTGHRPHP